jgi:hypothetical protein
MALTSITTSGPPSVSWPITTQIATIKLELFPHFTKTNSPSYFCPESLFTTMTITPLFPFNTSGPITFKALHVQLPPTSSAPNHHLIRLSLAQTFHNLMRQLKITLATSTLHKFDVLSLFIHSTYMSPSLLWSGAAPDERTLLPWNVGVLRFWVT